MRIPTAEMDKKNALIIGTNPGLRAAIRRCLEWSDRYDVVEASSGEDALEKASGRPFDLILIDVDSHRAGSSVLDARRQIETVRARGEAPVILVSAQVSDEAREIATGAGRVDILIKPFGLDRLLEMAARHAR